MAGDYDTSQIKSQDKALTDQPVNSGTQGNSWLDFYTIYSHLLYDISNAIVPIPIKFVSYHRYEINLDELKKIETIRYN